MRACSAAAATTKHDAGIRTPAAITMQSAGHQHVANRGYQPRMTGRKDVSHDRLLAPGAGVSKHDLHLVSVSSPELRLNVWAETASNAEALAEALYEARPRWRISIDGRSIVFSREGKVADFA
jgi:hypothetical protein